MRQDDGSDVGASFDFEKTNYLEELRQTMPLKTILSELRWYQLWLLNLHEIEGLNDEQIGQMVNQHPAVVRYEIEKIEAMIRARVKEIFGDSKFFRSEC